MLLGDSRELSNVTEVSSGEKALLWCSSLLTGATLGLLRFLKNKCKVCVSVECCSTTYLSSWKPNWSALLFNVPLSTSSESKRDDSIRILLASVKFFASGETTNAGELMSELLFPFINGALVGGSSIVPSKTVVVPSVLCTRMGGAGAETRLRGPS